MRVNDIPILTTQTRYKLPTGISVGGDPRFVPLYYIIEACESSGHTYFGTWEKLSRREKVILVTRYLIKQSIEGHKNDAQVREQIKRSKKK